MRFQGNWKTVRLGRTAIGVVTAASLLVAAPIWAQPLPGKRDEVHLRFNEEAKKLGTDNRMLLTECIKLTCSYTLSGKLAAIAGSVEEAPDEIDSVSLIFASGSDATSMLLSMGILMMVYSPESGKAERAAALSSLSQGIGKQSAKAKVVLGDVSYGIANLGTMGLLYTVKGREDR